ncbi:MAG: quinone oxidoreductase [Gammaproteobacteria bacterium]|nr:quinone oxidoreductase [Gammaproteobacteria bacterium]MDH3750311.1 quinone oxidoreductase [Gammaproteobacteria bacterium]MDH3804771.1 quinone oxidoreductase [Gammaproteobacteria bacterium]
MKTNAIRIHEFGGPEVLTWEDVDLADPAEGEAQIRHTAIGLNLIDTYHRTGLYPMDLPTGLGSEAAGVIETVGAGVTDVAVGDRVVYTGRPADAYSERRNFDASRLVHIPDKLSDKVAAAILLKGLTAWYLLRRSYRVQKDDPILLYAAAGGVGSLASQWAQQLGATVIGVVSTNDKAELARSQGCDHIIMADEDIAASVKELTAGRGVAAVYDSVGRDTFMASLDSLRPHGTMVTFGNASGPVEPFAPSELAKRGSLYVTRPILYDFIGSREQLLSACDELFEFVSSANVEVRIGQTYALKDAARAHQDIEARKTTGSTVLLP